MMTAKERIHESPATPPRQLRKSYAVTARGDLIDRAVNAATARFTASLSPAALVQPYFDWLMHLAVAPGKRMQLADRPLKKRCGSGAGWRVLLHRRTRVAPASSRCRRTAGSWVRRGSAGPTT
jgi:hypothetical protein